jgi:hypothetical protein
MYVISTIQDSFVNVEGAVFSIFMHHGATKKRCACNTILRNAWWTLSEKHDSKLTH